MWSAFDRLTLSSLVYGHHMMHSGQNLFLNCRSTENMSATTSRALRLLSLLQNRRYWPGVELAARLEVSARTLRRDVERLREMGYPVEAQRGVDGAPDWLRERLFLRSSSATRRQSHSPSAFSPLFRVAASSESRSPPSRRSASSSKSCRQGFAGKLMRWRQ